MKQRFAAFGWPRSLKKKLIIVLLASSLIPLTLIGAISYYTIYSVLDHKIEEGIDNNLSQMKLSLENSLNHLKFVSQQLSLDGSVGQNLQNYLTTKDLYEKKVERDEVLDEINLISFSNPNLGLICYYVPEQKKVLFSNYCYSSGLDFDTLPILADYWDQMGFAYYGPHPSRNPFNNHIVLSVAREVQIVEGRPLNVYIETEVQDVFEASRLKSNASHLIVSQTGKITYSDTTAFKVGETYLNHTQQDYYFFEDPSSQGWRIVFLVAKSEYNHEINQWFVRFFVLGASSLGISMLFAWMIWRTVYRPLKSLSREIMLISKSHFLSSPVTFTNVKEFDFLLIRFQDMRGKISDLLNEVRMQEERKASLEVEKLMYQINPHFIHNTLDTIRWLARLEGHDEIDRLVSMLNKVLYYNMGKGETATIQDEVGALQNYIALQHVRYNFQFDVRIDTDASVQDALIPRFILQPLVENALYHGEMSDDGIIRVTIEREDGEKMCIRVTDNGTGMDDKTTQQLIDRDDDPGRKSGLGIGINYVYRMIRHQFGDEAEFLIESEINVGTTIIMRLPYQKKEREQGWTS